MAQTIAEEVETYFANLTATSSIYTELGETLTSGTNLFVGFEPMNTGTCLTVIPYPSGSPSPEGDRHDSSVQVRLKCRSKQKSLRTMQSIINALHANTKVCSTDNGKVFANQSNPIPLEYQEGGEWFVTVSNYDIKHVKF